MPHRLASIGRRVFFAADEVDRQGARNAGKVVVVSAVEGETEQIPPERDRSVPAAERVVDVLLHLVRIARQPIEGRLVAGYLFAPSLEGEAGEQARRHIGAQPEL